MGGDRGRGGVSFPGHISMSASHTEALQVDHGTVADVQQITQQQFKDPPIRPREAGSSLSCC